LLASEPRLVALAHHVFVGIIEFPEFGGQGADRPLLMVVLLVPQTYLHTWVSSWLRTGQDVLAWIWSASRELQIIWLTLSSLCRWLISSFPAPAPWVFLNFGIAMPE
jgi:hypothetical protein